MTSRQAGPVHRSAGYFDDMKVGTLVITDAVQPLSTTSEPVFEVLLQNDPGSVSTVFVGNAFNQHLVLAINDIISLRVSNLNMIHVRTAGTATVNWIAMA